MVPALGLLWWLWRCGHLSSGVDAQGGQRLLLVINPQWQTQGQVVSDFGCACACAPAYVIVQLPTTCRSAGQLMWLCSDTDKACTVSRGRTLACLARRFGQSAAKAEAYLRGFETSYFLQRLDIEGEDVRLLRAYPSQWQVRSQPRT